MEHKLRYLLGYYYLFENSFWLQKSERSELKIDNRFRCRLVSFSLAGWILAGSNNLRHPSRAAIVPLSVLFQAPFSLMIRRREIARHLQRPVVPTICMYKSLLDLLLASTYLYKTWHDLALLLGFHWYQYKCGSTDCNFSILGKKLEFLKTWKRQQSSFSTYSYGINRCVCRAAFRVREFIIYLRRSFLATIFPQGRRLKRAAPALYVVFCSGTKCPGGKHSVITGNNRSRPDALSHSAHTSLDPTILFHPMHQRLNALETRNWTSH